MRLGITMNWKDYVQATIHSFREQFDRTEPDLQDQIQKNLFYQTLLKPCQVEVSDLGEHRAKVWLITHDSERKDLEITVNENVEASDIYIERYLKTNPYLKDYPKGWKAKLANLSMTGGHLELYTNYWQYTPTYALDIRGTDPSGYAEYMIISLRYRLSLLEHEKLEKNAQALKEDVALIAEENLRSRLENTSRKIDDAIQQIKRIEEHEQKLVSMEGEMKDFRTIVGRSKDFQFLKSFTSDLEYLKQTHLDKEVFNAKISELNNQIASFKEIREAYNKVLAQQAEVMKQQSSFITWIKYATILLPVAVISVPIIEIIRILLGIC